LASGSAITVVHDRGIDGGDAEREPAEPQLDVDRRALLGEPPVEAGEALDMGGVEVERRALKRCCRLAHDPAPLPVESPTTAQPGSWLTTSTLWPSGSSTNAP
jgi:hypothetical protein